jgi:hypothetical protein
MSDDGKPARDRTIILTDSARKRNGKEVLTILSKNSHSQVITFFQAKKHVFIKKYYLLLPLFTMVVL